MPSDGRGVVQSVCVVLEDSGEIKHVGVIGVVAERRRARVRRAVREICRRD